MFIRWNGSRILLESGAIRLASVGMINATRGDKVKKEIFIDRLNNGRFSNYQSPFCFESLLCFTNTFSHWCRELMVENQSKTVRCSHDNGAMSLINLTQRSNQPLLPFSCEKLIMLNWIDKCRRLEQEIQMKRESKISIESRVSIHNKVTKF